MLRTVHNQKSHFLPVGSGATIIYRPAFKYKIFIKVFQYILKSIKTFLIQNFFYSDVKKYI